MDVSDITALQTTTSPSLKNITSISGYQYIGKFLHIVCQDEEVGYDSGVFHTMSLKLQRQVIINTYFSIT